MSRISPSALFLRDVVAPIHYRQRVLRAAEDIMFSLYIRSSHYAEQHDYYTDQIYNKQLSNLMCQFEWNNGKVVGFQNSRDQQAVRAPQKYIIIKKKREKLFFGKLFFTRGLTGSSNQCWTGTQTCRYREGNCANRIIVKSAFSECVCVYDRLLPPQQNISVRRVNPVGVRAKNTTHYQRNKHKAMRGR